MKNHLPKVARLLELIRNTPDADIIRHTRNNIFGHEAYLYRSKPEQGFGGACLSEAEFRQLVETINADPDLRNRLRFRP